MPEQDNLEFRKKTYKNLKTAFGDDYTLTEEQFNKNMDSDTAFVTKTYKNLKTAFGDDYSMVEEDFKKKVLPISGSPTTSAYTNGSSPTQPSSGSGVSQSPAYSVKVDEGPMRKGQPSTVTVGGKEFEVAPTPELTSTEVKSTANKLFKIASPITSAAPKIPQSPVMDGVVKPTDEAAISNLSPKAASGNEDVLTEYISTLNEADQNRLRGSKMNDEQSFEILTKAYAPRLEQAVIDLSILRDRGVENDLKAIDDSQKQMQTLTQTISADKTALVDLQATFLKQKGYDKISSEYKSINKQLQVKQTELAPLFKEQQQLETTLKQFESLIQDGNFVGNEQEYNAYQETYKAYEQLTQSPELANYNNLVKKQNEISSSINSMVTPEYKAQEEKLLGRINTTVASANTLMQNSQGLLTPEKIENIELYKQTVEEYNSITNKLQTAKSKMPDVIEKEAYINAMNAAVKDNPYLKAFDLSAKAIGGFTEAVGSLLSAVPSFTGGMSNEYTFSDKVSESITNFFAPSITNTQTTTAGRPSAAYQPFYDSEIDHIDWSSLPDEIANQAGAFAVLAGSGVLGGMAKFSEISSVVVPGALISYNDAYKTGREIYGDDAFSATAYATASSLITGITELIMPDRDILTGGSIDKIAKNYVVNYAKKGKRFAIERSLLDLTEMMGKEVTEEFADRWKDVLLKGVVNMTGGDIDNDIPTLNEQLSIAASTAALTGGVGAFSQRGKNSKARQLAVYQSAKSYPETITMLNTMEQEGYDADRIDAIKSEVTNMFVTLKEVPADLSAPKRIAIAEKLNTIKKIEDAMASGISPFIADRMNDSIKKISDDIQNIITDPNYDEVFGKEVNEDVAKSEDVTVTGMPVVEITPTTEEMMVEEVAKPTVTDGVVEPVEVIVPKDTEVDLKVSPPSDEQKLKDVQQGNVVTFVYNKESDIPSELKERVSTFGSTNGKIEYKITLPKSEADYLLNKKEVSFPDVVTPTTEETVTPEPAQSEVPTKESVTEKLNINSQFYKNVEDALVKLGLIEKYNPETKSGDVVGSYIQGDGNGGFASGDMYFKADGSISYVKNGVIVTFDKDGNIISENTKEAADEARKIKIQGAKDSISLLEQKRDSDDFRYKEVTETDAIGNRKKVKKLKSPQELKDSTDKINAVIDKTKAELAALSQPIESIEAKKADIEIGKVGNTEYEVKVDGVYYQGKKLNNPENKTHRQLIEADIERRRQEELNKANKQIEEDFPIQADKLKQDLVDLVELSKRRKLFIEEYKNIKSSPENFNTAPKPTSTSEPVPNDTKTITLKTKDGEEQLEVNENYVAGAKEIKTKEGNTIPAFLKFTLLGETEEGDVLIKTKDGKTHTISKSAFEDYKLGKVSALSKAQRFFVENSKRIFNFQMKGGKSIPGSITYDKNERKLYFESQEKRKDGKPVKRIPLNNDLSQFSPQGGYNRAQIWTEGEYSQETQDAVNAPLSQEEINDQKNIEGKIAERRNILRQAKQQIQEKVDRVNNKLVAKKEQLKNLEQEVKDLLELREKNKYDNTTKITNFNKVVSTSIKGLARLSTLKTELENEIADLEQLKAELAFDISYFEDFEQNLEELPTSLKEFRNELKSQIKGLEDITVSIGKDINSFTKMIATIQDVIKDFASLLKSAISKINSDYPSYIKDSFDRIIAGNDYMAEANSLKEYISDLKFTEDTEKEIKLNEDKINEISNKIQDLYKQLEEVGNEQRAKQKILDAFEVVIQRELAKKAEEAKVANNKELQNKLEQQQKDNDNQSGVSNTEEPQEEFTYSKADLTTFLSKEADFYDTSAEKLEPLEEVKINRSHQKRRLNLLNYLARVFDTKANDYKVLAISRSNEETYGLKGLIDYMLSESKDKLDKDPIVKLYVKKEGDKLFIIDKEGKNIKELSQEDSLPNLVENGVFGVFHDEIGEYKKGSKAGEKNFSGEYSEEDLTKVKQQFEDWKTRVNQSTESIIYDIQGISRGISLRDGENKSVFKTGLITKVDLEQTNLIQVPSKEGSITTKDGVSLKLPLGQPVLVKGGNIELLNNRQFTPQESKSIFSVLKQYVKLSNEQNNEAKKLGTYLRGVLYFSTPKEGKPVTKGQIYFSKGNLHFGEEITIPFTESSVQANESRILEFLENTYNNTNSHYLTSADYHNQPFFSYDENLREVKHENYQAFLLLGDNPFLQTTLRPLDNNRPNIISRYTILSYNSEFDYKVAPKQQQIAEPVKQDSELTIEQVKGLKIKNVKSGKETNLTLNGVKITSEPGFLKDGMNTITLDRLNKNLKDGIYTIVSGSKPIIPTSSQQYTLENVNGVTFKNSKGIQGTVSIENGMIILPIFKGGRTVTNLNEINSLAERGLLTVISDEVEQPFQEEIQQEQQEESEFEKAKKAAKNAPIDREEYKLAEEFTNYKQEDVIKFLQYVKDKTPFNVQLLNQILKTPNGINAWGSYKDMVIKLYEAAIEGTGYHEVFEGVYKEFLSTKEKENLYKEFKERKGNFTFFDGEQYSSIPYSEATQFQMKETLADEFSEFVLKPHEPQSLISKWFNNLWNFIKSILSGRVMTIEDVFKKIDSGVVKNNNLILRLAVFLASFCQ